MYTKNWILHKNVLITGTSSGIGFEVAKLLASKYFCNVYGVGRNPEKLENSKNKIEEEIGKYFEKLSLKQKKKHKIGTYNCFQADVSSFESFSELKANLDKVHFVPDIIICNAGIMPAFEKFEAQTIQTVEKVFQTNFFSQVYAYELFREDLKKNKGAFYGVSSSSALCPVVGQALYSSSKGAVKNFLESISVEHKKEFLVGVIMPGYAKTELFREQQNLSKLVQSVSMPSKKMANKIVRAIRRRKRRVVIGFDAHLMNGLYKFFPASFPRIMGSVLSSAHDPMFDNVFDGNSVRRKNKKQQSVTK